MKEIKFILFFVCISFNAQTKITGMIKLKNNHPLPYVNVLLQDSLNVIVAYSYSSEKGLYNFKTKKKGNFKLKFSSLGFESRIIPINIDNKDIVKNIVLKEVPYSLDEVIVTTDKTITIKKDTITFKVNRFLQGNEAVIEDLLKKIPGISVNSEGTIKIGNKEIEKLMIDGDDFFDRGYKILSKNMPPDQIDKIELLQKYSNNKLLKDVEESDKVALNLVLKKNAKRRWFGNFSLGYDITLNNRYSLKSYLMNFGKKNKYIFFTNLNDIGYDATGDIQHLIKPFRNGEPASIGDNQSALSLINLSSFTPNFKASRTNFNNAELASLNAIFKLSKKVKLKTLGFFNWDENDFFRNSITNFTSNNTDFINTEDFNLRNKKFVGFGKIDLFYDISKNKTLKFITKYNNQEDKKKANLLFNSQQTKEQLKNKNNFFDQKITYTNKFKNNKVFLLTGRYINEKTPQNYSINQFLYADLFPNNLNTNNVQQLSKNKMQFAGFEAHLLDRKENGNLLELQFGNQYRIDKLATSFLLKDNNSIINKPTDYQNDLIYKVNDLYFNTKYRLKINDFGITGKLDFHQLFNKIEQQNGNNKQQPFYINPKLKIDWEINTKNKLYLSYSYHTSNSKIKDVVNNYTLTSFRSFNKGTNGFNQLDASNINFNYQLGNWSDNFFANVSMIYTKNFDYFSSNSIITQNHSQSEKILIKDRESISTFSDINRYFKTISSNFKINLSYTKSNYKNKINNSDLREIKSINYSAGFELRSGFQGMFNYHFGSKWSTNKIQSTFSNSYTNNVSFLDLSFDINKKLDIQIQTERYLFDDIDTNNNTYYFADLEARYKIKKNKLTLSLSGKNLFNTNTFKTFFINDINTSTTEYKLLPRYVLVKMEYRF
jgi:hypothetical protein